MEVYKGGSENEALSENEADSTEQTSQSEQVFDESLYEYTVELQEIPEMSYCSVSEMSGTNYVCYKDILILGNTIYRKEAGKYVKQELTLNAIFNIRDDWTSVECKQHKNLIIAVSEDRTSFLTYDMDTHSEYCCYSVEENMKIGPLFWYVYDGCIYYSEWIEENTVKKIDPSNGDNVEIYQPVNEKRENCGFSIFAIRSDGTIMYGIYDEGGHREYWIAEVDGNGEWSEKKIWENNAWRFAHILDFNQYGLIILGESSLSCFYETIAIKDNGETVKLDENLTYGEYLFTDNGYFSSNLAELEHMPWDNDSVESEWLSRNLADSVSFYDYEGNKLNTYPMISKELLEQGYYLSKLTYCEGKLTGFYVQRDTEELYISQVDVDINY